MPDFASPVYPVEIAGLLLVGGASTIAFSALPSLLMAHTPTTHLLLVNIAKAWEPYSTLGVLLPGVRHHCEQAPTASQPRGCSTPTDHGRAPPAISETPVVKQSTKICTTATGGLACCFTVPRCCQ